MIFKQLDELRSGAKIQTRRLVKPGEKLLTGYDWRGIDPEDRILVAAPARVVVEKPAGKVENPFGGWIPIVKQRTKWTVGGLQPIVPKMYQKSIGRIQITGIRQERLQDITEEDALKEGIVYSPIAKSYYTSTLGYGFQTYANACDTYQALWESINGKTKGARWADNPCVFVIDFKVVEWFEQDEAA